MNAETFGGLAKPMISGPQKSGGIDQDGSDQVGVNQANAQAMQTTSLDRQAHFAQLRHSYLWQKVQQGERPGSVMQGSKCKFRNDERMDHNLALVKMLAQRFVSGAKVVDPNGGVCENQCGRTLRRGIAFNPGMVLPRDANLRALSRSMRALRASRISAVFSATPVNSWAMRTKSSSSATVVRI